MGDKNSHLLKFKYYIGHFMQNLKGEFKIFMIPDGHILFNSGGFK